MTSKSKIGLFILIFLAGLGLITYGYLSIQKLESKKIKEVDSNIENFLYDENSDTLTDDKEEDLDGDAVEDEDTDFEVYEEEEDWGDESAPVDNSMPEEKVKTDENELEELYDNEPKAAKEKEAVATPNPKAPKASTDKQVYQVIAGSFSSKKNAERKLRSLKKVKVVGTIIQFEDSKLFSVIAGEFSTETEATIFAKRLKEEHGLSAFVKDQ